MPDEAVPMRQIGEAGQPARWLSSYLGRVLGKAWARVPIAGLRSQHDQRSDGLEALDMLGGWQGSDARRRKK